MLKVGTAPHACFILEDLVGFLGDGMGKNNGHAAMQTSTSSFALSDRRKALEEWLLREILEDEQRHRGSSS